MNNRLYWQFRNYTYDKSNRIKISVDRLREIKVNCSDDYPLTDYERKAINTYSEVFGSYCFENAVLNILIDIEQGGIKSTVKS